MIPQYLRPQVRTAGFLILTIGLLVHAAAGPTPPAHGATTLSFSAGADAYTDSNQPRVNFGGSSSLFAVDEPGKSRDRQSYVRFSVSGVVGQVESAILRVFVREGSSDGPAAVTTSTSWSEGSITWANAPATSSNALDDRGSIAGGAYVDYDVTTAVSGNGEYSFALIPTSRDSVELSLIHI